MSPCPRSPIGQDTSVQTGALQALDTWLAEDLTRVEGKLTQRDAVAALVDLYARSHRAQETQVMRFIKLSAILPLVERMENPEGK